MEDVRIQTTQFSASEIIANFQALYETLEIKGTLPKLGIGSLQFIRQRKALREIKALAIAFWGLALEKSFPNDATQFFSEYLETSPEVNGSTRASVKLRERVLIYVDLAKEKKDTDFMPLAAYLAESLDLDSNGNTAHAKLKLSLMMRSLYTLIFDKLV